MSGAYCWYPSGAPGVAPADQATSLPTARPVSGEPRTLRWVLAHMTGETTRHAGDADILRELVDRVTVRCSGQRDEWGGGPRAES
ncbi:mycothiol transferase [Micromonospora saelicesensis]|uniref:mycothiol transferase n=1 Tax=Micromonospora saelicesensis TaxID=285676 RepID=UPI000DD5FC7C|nr:DUF664 domain-containing protein [Micromonospora saelicesensis]